MKSNELKIGNWIKLKECDIESIVDYVSDHNVSLVGNGIVNRLGFVEGIKLTEEWLIKLGCEGGYFGEDDVFKFVDVIGGVIQFSDKCANEKMRGVSICKMAAFVHNFQNVHLMLTGEELTIKQ